ncbi:hypothetical protein CHUAL_007490 [Chamberlinius hualienensis]
MEAQCKHYSFWNLDATAKMLANTFEGHDILAIRPSKMSRNQFSCFKNFVHSDLIGCPTYSTELQGSRHLKQLLLNCYTHLDEVDRANLVQLPKSILTIIGFSKGCVVLNQLLYEMYHNRDTDEIKDLIKQIKTMSWLDAGHNGEADVWITDENILKFLAETGIEVQVHVTPYQMEDIRRPWIKEQKTIFVETLKTFDCNVAEKYHFYGEIPRIDLHFELLAKFAI